MDRSWVVQMGFLAAAELMMSLAFQRHIGIQTQRIEGLLMAILDIFLDIRHRKTTDAGYGIGEVPVDHILIDADCLEDLTALIALNCGNAHLGGNLDDTVQYGFVIVVHGSIVILLQKSLLDQAADRLLRQIGVYGTGAVTQERREMMNLPGFRGFQNQGNGRAFFRAHQVLGDSGHSQQAGDRDMILVDIPIGQDQDIIAVPIGAIHF